MITNFRIEKEKIKKLNMLTLKADKNILKVKKLIENNSESIFIQEIIKIRLEKLIKLQQKNKNTLLFLTNKIRK